MTLWKKGFDRSISLITRFMSTRPYLPNLSRISIHFLRYLHINCNRKLILFRLNNHELFSSSEFGSKLIQRRSRSIAVPFYSYKLYQRFPRPRLIHLVPFPMTIAFAVLTPVKCEDVICKCTLSKGDNTQVPSSGSCNSCGGQTQRSPGEITPSSSSSYTPPVTDWLEPKDMTNGALIKQACILTVDSVTRILSQVVLAIEDYHGQYRTLLDVMIEMLDECRTCSAGQQELLDCKLVVIRSRIEEMKKNISTLEAYMANVEKLALAASETAFLGNAEYQSTAMMERLDSAMRYIKEIKTESKRLERDMLELQSMLIIESGKSLK